MSTSSYDSVFRTEVGTTIIAAGATNALLFDYRAGWNSLSFKYLQGGSLIIMDCAALGSTTTLANLATQFTANQFYLMGTSEVMSFDGPARVFLAAVGTSVQISYIRGISQGV